MEENKFDNMPAMVELFGHQKIAGYISEHSLGPSVFIRVNVPETDTHPKFSRLFNPSAIYALNPVTEEVMLHFVKEIEAKPLDQWDIREYNKKLQLQLKEGVDPEDLGF